MKRFLHRLGFRNTTKDRFSTARKPALQPSVEVLEDRQLLSITDMTGVAQLFPRHSGPTMLYLNFDGYSGQGVSSFQSTSGDRSKDIHDVLYRTSELFAPFDVQVRRIYGNGNYDSSSNGNTTIFIGDKSGNGTGANNNAYAYTPFAYSDFPGAVRGIHHQPNSDPFDLAFVDPVYGSANTSWSDVTIARAIAHEAGHTFGLAHVLSNPDQEIMSYDASNVRFYNKTFNITDLNYDGTSTTHNSNLQPQWYVTIPIFWTSFDVPVNITTQDSYTFLQTVLGPRTTAGDLANVADSTAVDASYVDGGKWNMSPGFSLTAYLQQTGDFDVYNLSTATSKNVVINVKQVAGSSVDPVVMVYNSTGQTLLSFNDDGGGYPNSRIVFHTTAGQNYQVVVGAYGENSAGGYQITVGNYFTGVVVKATNLNLAAKTSLQTMAVANLATSVLQGSGQGTDHSPMTAIANTEQSFRPHFLAEPVHDFHGLMEENESLLQELGRRLSQRHDALHLALNQMMDNQGEEESVRTHC